MANDSKAKAEEVADYLLTNGNGERAERLVLTGADGADLGGWCRAALVEILRGALDGRAVGLLSGE